MADSFDPRVVGVDSSDMLGHGMDYEENYPPEECNPELIDIITMVARCLVLLIFVFFYVFVFVNVARGNKVKNWPLYSLVALVIFLWLAMSLYYDHFDRCFVQEIYRFPQRRSIYWCFLNLLHGLSLYLAILLLAHLSELQHTRLWLWLVLICILFPLAYTVPLLIIDLNLVPEERKVQEKKFSWYWNVGLSSARVALYNVIPVIIMIVFANRFCTARLTSTYEERRSLMSILVARWTFSFLLLHHLVAMASYAVTVVTRVPGHDPDLAALTVAHQVLDEVAWLLIVLAVPVGFVAASLIHAVTGNSDGRDMEMDKMDKIYQEVWTTGLNQPRKGRNGSVSVDTNPLPGAAVSSNPNRSSNMSINASNTSLASNASGVPKRNPTSINPMADTSEKRNRRTSYLDAVSMGSLDQADRVSVSSHSTSVTSEPIDL